MVDAARHLVFMGVSGSGKSTAARAVNERLNWAFAEGDEFHSEESVAKMAAGHPLTDADRMPWLGRLAAWVREHDRAGQSTVMSCSALRHTYREVLRTGGAHTWFVHLTCDKGTLLERMSGREHFMPPSLLESQLDTLEPLGDDETGIVVDVGQTPAAIADEVIRRLDLP